MTVVTAALAYGYTCHLSLGLFLKKSARHAAAGPELKDVAGHQPETVPQKTQGLRTSGVVSFCPEGLVGKEVPHKGRNP